MLRTFTSATLLLASFALPASATQEADGRALLERARSAVSGLRSATYSMTSERRVGGEGETAQGRVKFQRIAGEDSVGNKLALEGQFDGKGPGGADLKFKLTYDGERVRGILGEEPKLWTGTAASAADILMFGDALLMKGLVDVEQLATDATAETITLGESSEIGGVEVVAVECQHGELQRYRKAVWYLGVQDHLPRQVVADYHARGVALTEVQKISDLVVNPEIYAAVFQLRTPAGFEVAEYVSPRAQEQGPVLLPVGSLAPDFTLKDPAGKAHKLSDYKGKLVVLDFWATWCPPCRRAMPLVQKLHERFAKTDAVRVFGISTAENANADPAGYMRDEGYTYGLLLNGETMAQRYLAASLPTFYVIGKDGKVLHASVGFEPDLDETIGALLEAQL